MKFELYSQRIRGEGLPDYYLYDEMPEALINQVIHVFEDFFYAGYSRVYDQYLAVNFYHAILTILAREYGRETMYYYEQAGACENAYEHFRTCNIIEKLDFVELVIDLARGKYSQRYDFSKIGWSKANEAVNELNIRFRQNCFGYSIENYKIIRIDSNYSHAELVKPSLAILSGKPDYANAQDEFISALEAFRHLDFETTISKASCAFESVMKVIATKREWDSPETIQKNTAQKLISLCLQNELVPASMQAQLSNLQNLFLASLPAIRNASGIHGKGCSEEKATHAVASLALNLSATYILFLIDLDEQ